MSPYERALKYHAGVQLHKEELLTALAEQNRKLNESLLQEQREARAFNEARAREMKGDTRSKFSRLRSV